MLVKHIFIYVNGFCTNSLWCRGTRATRKWPIVSHSNSVLLLATLFANYPVVEGEQLSRVWPLLTKWRSFCVFELSVEDLDNLLPEAIIGKTKVLAKFGVISSSLSFTNLGEIFLRMIQA